MVLKKERSESESVQQDIVLKRGEVRGVLETYEGSPEISRSVKRLDALTTLAEKICRPVTLEDILSIVSSFIYDLVAPERAAIFIEHKFSETLRVKGFGFIEESYDKWPISQNLLRRVREDHEAILSFDASNDFSMYKSVRAENIRSIICVPLLDETRTNVGFIYLDNSAKTICFTEEDLRFLIAISRYVDLAIQSAIRIEMEHQKIELADARYAALQEELFAKHRIVGNSEPLLAAYERLKKVAATDLPVLITGESGTGKELFARAVHSNSSRMRKPFISISLGALTPTLVESELFGHEKGAFTGATTMKRGKLELADGGTLFLDELCETPLEVQAKLLRVLQEKSFERVGGTQAVRSDFRLVSATSRDIPQRVKENAFREDLYYRIAGETIIIPPLRERSADIALLAHHILQEAKFECYFSKESLEVMRKYAWPGNIRMLQHAVISSACRASGKIIEVENLPEAIRGIGSTSRDRFPTLAEVLSEAEKKHFAEAVWRAKSNQEAIQLLGISTDKFYQRVKIYEDYINKCGGKHM